MQQSSVHSVSELGIARQRPMPGTGLRLHNGRQSAPAARPVAEVAPLHSVQTIATTMFVMTAAAGWIIAASLVTAPLVGAGELLGRAARTSGH
jgi:hypothetical protein